MNPETKASLANILRVIAEELDRQAAPATPETPQNAAPRSGGTGRPPPGGG